MKFDLVVTRHQVLLDYLVKKGLVDNDVDVVIHATADDVKGKKVIGVLPYSLACLTEMFAEVTLELPLELRGKELSLEDVEKHAKGINCYRVENPFYVKADELYKKKKNRTYLGSVFNKKKYLTT